eukprot:CAMPEP_0181297514 /NCGR_PEP_ID=MMETSP1101-20121128/5281_1 /TAXON_ID=46948 /ORGANISM="Rhodomonas abbreviata, Strain Caron Lab Isolate" /LENGTH=253 /DNA_ID=CAMNT_0023402457 /DNA_START=11 /DNA_END=772 /DNA_ORIENTATION=+
MSEKNLNTILMQAKVEKKHPKPPSRRSTCPELDKKMLEKLGVEVTPEETEMKVLERMRRVQKEVKGQLTECHTTLESTGQCLENFFRHLPAKALQSHIDARFEAFDRDQNGILDREEVRAGMAQMGQRPTNEELDDFYKHFDRDGNGGIDKEEFSRMVFIKLKLLTISELEEESKERRLAAEAIAQEVASDKTASGKLARRAVVNGKGSHEPPPTPRNATTTSRNATSRNTSQRNATPRGRGVATVKSLDATG